MCVIGLVINTAVLLTRQLLLQFLGDFVVVEERRKERKICTGRMKGRIMER
jgi:hypothetical protein